jgi:galactokinase
MMIRSDTPEGAGVSSSAALSVATVLALSTLAGAPLQKLALARAAQKVEREHVGVPCGLMDQWASACGEAGQLLAMDFLTQQSEPVVVPANLALLIIDSGVRHANDDGAYAAVARACQDAAAALGVEHLRSAADFDRLEAPLRDKALYVRDENARVTAMAAALKSNDARTAGAILNASHQDLKRRFGVVVDATDRLAMLARSEPGVFGARQMGAGFGGSVVALCAADYASDSLSRILDRYCADERARANSFVARLGPGAGEVAT